MNASRGPEQDLGSLLRGLRQAFDAFRAPASTGAMANPDLVSQLQTLSPAEFEAWVADRLVESGYEVLRTGGPGDEGIDISARKHHEHVVVQCKRFRTARVGPHVVRELLGCVTATGANRGILVTTGIATTAAMQYARRQRPPIELWDGNYLAGRWPRSIPVSSSPAQPGPWIPARTVKRNRQIGRRLRPPSRQQPPRPLI